MATLTESQAVFEAKLKDMGLEGYKDEMTRRGDDYEHLCVCQQLVAWVRR